MTIHIKLSPKRGQVVLTRLFFPIYTKEKRSCLLSNWSSSFWQENCFVFSIYEGCSNMNASSFITFFTYMIQQNGKHFYKGIYVTFKLAPDTKQEGPRALDRSPYSLHMSRWCIGLKTKEIWFTDISNVSSGNHVVQPSWTFWSFLVEGIIRTISGKLFWSWTSGSGDVI